MLLEELALCLFRRHSGSSSGGGADGGCFVFRYFKKYLGIQFDF
jgi:hypothetical protein